MILGPEWLALFFAIGPALLAVGTLLGLVVGHLDRDRGMRLALICATVASLLVAVSTVLGWLEGWPQFAVVESAPPPLPAGNFPTLSLSFALDDISAFFLLLVGTLSACVCIYSFGWLTDKEESHRISDFYNAFVFFILLSLMTSSLFYLLVFLECASLAFSYLTLYRHNLLRERDEPDLPQARMAFVMYVVFSHLGLAFLMVASSLLALNAGGFGFDDLQASAHKLEGTFEADIVFLLAVIGLGIKGGFVPAHFWVAVVHPKSPTTTHALTLGIVIKIVSLYPLLRFCFQFLSDAPWWWGALLMQIGGFTALVGVIYALTAHDLKAALASHSVENLGIMVVGIGSALLFFDTAPELASLGLIAGLYHVLNHTFFKGALYLCTGTIEQRTKSVRPDGRVIWSVELDKLGGLIHYMPWTAATFLIGAMALVGFPPLNGFISKWLTLQALFAGLDGSIQAPAKPWIVAGVLLTLLALVTAFALTALAFTKIAGMVLLGSPRQPREALDTGAVEQQLHLQEQNTIISENDHTARERRQTQRRSEGVPWNMRSMQLLLVLICLLLGLAPGLVVQQLNGIARQLLNSPSLVGGPFVDTVRVVTSPRGNYSAELSIFPVIALCAVPLLLGAILLLRRPAIRAGKVWNFGAPHNSEGMQITPTAYTAALMEPLMRGREVDASTGRASSRSQSQVEHPPETPKYVPDYFQKYFHQITEWLSHYSEVASAYFQNGDIRWYLTYLFVAVCLVLLVFGLTPT